MAERTSRSIAPPRRRAGRALPLLLALLVLGTAGCGGKLTVALTGGPTYHQGRVEMDIREKSGPTVVAGPERFESDFRTVGVGLAVHLQWLVSDHFAVNAQGFFSTEAVQASRGEFAGDRIDFGGIVAGPWLYLEEDHGPFLGLHGGRYSASFRPEPPGELPKRTFSGRGEGFGVLGGWESAANRWFGLLQLDAFRVDSLEDVPRTTDDPEQTRISPAGELEALGVSLQLGRRWTLLD